MQTGTILDHAAVEHGHASLPELFPSASFKDLASVSLTWLLHPLTVADDSVKRMEDPRQGTIQAKITASLKARYNYPIQTPQRR